jgi:hypothetical protein
MITPVTFVLAFAALIGVLILLILLLVRITNDEYDKEVQAWKDRSKEGDL